MIRANRLYSGIGSSSLGAHGVAPVADGLEHVQEEETARSGAPRTVLGELLLEVLAGGGAGDLIRLVLLVELGDVADIAGERVDGVVDALIEVRLVADQGQLRLAQPGAVLPDAERHRDVHPQGPVGELAAGGLDAHAAG